MSTIYSRLISFILEYWGEEEFTARQFAEKHNFNYHTVRKYLEELADTGYLETRKNRKRVFYRLRNPHKLSELERELAGKDMFKAYREEIERLRKEIRKLRFKLSQYKNLIDEEELRRTPDSSVISLSTPTREKSTVERIMDILYEMYCTKNLIRVKNEPEPT